MESTAEGEAQRYFDHALTLKNTILFLRYNKELTQDQGPDIPNIGNYAVTLPLFSNEHFDEDTGVCYRPSPVYKTGYPSYSVGQILVKIVYSDHPMGLHPEVCSKARSLLLF